MTKYLFTVKTRRAASYAFISILLFGVQQITLHHSYNNSTEKVENAQTEVSVNPFLWNKETVVSLAQGEVSVVEMVSPNNPETQSDSQSNIKRQNDSNVTPMLEFADNSNPSSNRVVVSVNHHHMLWHGGQRRLCNMLKQMTNTSHVGGDWNTVAVGHGSSNRTSPIPLLRLELNCQERANDETYGQGNWITAFYHVRLAAALAQVDFEFACQEGKLANFHRQLLPFMQGYFPAPITNRDDNGNDINHHPWPYYPRTIHRPSAEEACTNRYERVRIDKMALLIQSDVRKLANQVVSGPDPLVKNVTLDDVAIHFRCGDVMGVTLRNDFGMIPFREYRKRIFPNSTSIGIVTQPFRKEQNRNVDASRVEACSRVVYKLVEYLQEFFPAARISIRNDPDQETLSIAWARLVLAKQSFTSLSSFGIFPVVATTGEGYFQKGSDYVNPWAKYIPEYLPNVHQMEASVMGSKDIHDLLESENGLDSLLEWFVAEGD